MSYADIVATVALLVAFFSVMWQIYTWSQQKKREETPILKVVIKTREIKDPSGKFAVFNYVRGTFYIQNIGNCSIQILSCSIDSIPIESDSALKNPNFIINAKVRPGNFVSSEINQGHRLQGKIATIKCKLDSGKFFDEKYTLSEEQE